MPPRERRAAPDAGEEHEDAGASPSEGPDAGNGAMCRVLSDAEVDAAMSFMLELPPPEYAAPAPGRAPGGLEPVPLGAARAVPESMRDRSGPVEVHATGTPSRGTGEARVEQREVTLPDLGTVRLPVVNLHYNYPSTPWIDMLVPMGALLAHVRVFSRLTGSLMPAAGLDTVTIESTGVLVDFALAQTDTVYSSMGVDFSMEEGAPPGFYTFVMTQLGGGLTSSGILEAVPPNQLIAIWVLRQLVPTAPLDVLGWPAKGRVGAGFMMTVDFYAAPRRPQEQEVTDLELVPNGVRELLAQLRDEHPERWAALRELTGAALFVALAAALIAAFGTAAGLAVAAVPAAAAAALVLAVSGGEPAA